MGRIEEIRERCRRVGIFGPVCPAENVFAQERAYAAFRDAARADIPFLLHELAVRDRALMTMMCEYIEEHYGGCWGSDFDEAKKAIAKRIDQARADLAMADGKPE